MSLEGANLRGLPREGRASQGAGMHRRMNCLPDIRIKDSLKERLSPSATCDTTPAGFIHNLNLTSMDIHNFLKGLLLKLEQEVYILIGLDIGIIRVIYVSFTQQLKLKLATNDWPLCKGPCALINPPTAGIQRFRLLDWASLLTASR